jgi:hypothetical protein
MSGLEIAESPTMGVIRTPAEIDAANAAVLATMKAQARHARKSGNRATTFAAIRGLQEASRRLGGN